MARHLEGCKLSEKRYGKLVSILENIRSSKDVRAADQLLVKFANKCYGKEPDRDVAKSQANQFLEALFGGAQEILSVGPQKAIENKLHELYANTDDEMKNQDKKAIKAIPITRNQKSEEFSALTHGKDLKKGNIEESPIWTKKLDRFLVGPTLGVGGTATVKLAYDTKHKTQVALKILQPKYAFSAQKEIDVLKNLKHDNIIRIYECFDNVIWNGGKTTVFAIEYADGGELIEYLMYTAKFEEELARWFFAKLIAGMEYCHSKNVVHRDLKHDNCLLGHDFNLKITDFGFARYFFKNDKEQMKTAIGTAQYAAPEILAAKKYNEKVDVFSMGVMLFIALAGSQPWRKADYSKDRWYYMAYKGKWADFWDYHTRSHTFTKPAKALLQGMLAHKPDQRWSISDIKKCDWFNGKKISDAKAAKKLKDRKKTMDRKKFDKSKRDQGTRKAIDEDDRKMMAKANPPQCDLIKLPLTSFYTDENAWLMREFIKNAVDRLKGSIKSDDKENFEMIFEVKKLLRGLSDDETVVKGRINIYTSTLDKKRATLVVFTRMDSSSALYLPQVYNDMMAYLACYRIDCPAE